MSLVSLQRKGKRTRAKGQGTDYTPRKLDDTHLKILKLCREEPKRWTAHNLCFRVNTSRKKEGKKNLAFSTVSRAISQLVGLKLLEAYPRQKVKILDEETQVWAYVTHPTYQITLSGLALEE